MKLTAKSAFKFLSLLPATRTLKRVDEEGLLYTMNYNGNYYKLLPVLNSMAKIGCSMFAHKNLKNEPIVGRNFDLRHFYKNHETGETEITGLAVVVKTNNKKAKYKSIGIADAIYLDPSCKMFHRGIFDTNKKSRIRAVMLPFLVMDGVNEEGLCVSVLHLSLVNIIEKIEYKELDSFTKEEQEKIIVLKKPGEKPDKSNGRLNKGQIILNVADKIAWIVNKEKATCQNEPGKERVIHTVLMRYILDNCKDCDEAAKLALSYNMISEPNSDNHIIVSDAKGNSIALEWIDNKLTVENCYHTTNFYNNRKDKFGYGYNRDDVLANAIKKHSKGMSEEDAMKALKEASQNCLEDKDYGYTQWSAVYNLVQKTFDVVIHSKWEKVYHFDLKTKK